jgi:hypothetical protein
VITWKQRLPDLKAVAIAGAVATEPQRIAIAARTDEKDPPPRKAARKKASGPKQPLRKKSGKI